MKKILAVLLALPTLAAAQANYPSKPIRIVLPFGPGGVADITTRTIAPKLTESLGQPIVVDNKPGAGGIIASEAVAKAEPDGYTLLMGTPGLATNAWMYQNLPFDPLKDLAPVSLIGSVPNALIVTPSLPANSVRELIAMAKAQPGRIDFASSGNGSSQHLVGALFNTMAGVELNHVPYKGSGPAMQDLIAGQVGVEFAGVPNVISHVKSGRLRALGVTLRRKMSAPPPGANPWITLTGLSG